MVALLLTLVVTILIFFWTHMTSATDLAKVQAIGSFIGPLFAGAAIWFTLQNYEKQRKHEQNQASLARKLSWRRDLYLSSVESIVRLQNIIGKCPT